MAESFYLPLREGVWRATEHTTGPWDSRAQHGGPPSALLGTAIERVAPRADMMIARFTCEILGAIPVGDLTVHAHLTRPGRSVEMLEAAASAGGRRVAEARAWRVRRGACPPVTAPVAGPAGPLPGPMPYRPPETWGEGYLSAVEWRPVSGRFGDLGPAAVWARLRYPLVADEETSPLARVLAIADSGSGVSGVLDIASWNFINPELTVHLHREAAGEWICLDSRTTVSTQGVGLATSVLSDLTGPVGAGAQALLITPR